VSPLQILFEDLRSQREGLLSQGFWALLVYRFGHARYRIPSKWVRLPWTVIYLLLNKFVGEMVCGICLPAYASVGRRVVIEHFGAIVVHGNATIGDDCVIRQGVTIGNRRLDQPEDAPILGNRVDVGAGAKILGRVVIGDDASIGANAVVLHDVPARHIAVGVPARIFPKRPSRDPS